MLLVKILGGLVGVLVLLIGGLLVGARFADGPLAIVAGGPFRSGELVTGAEPDWSFVRDIGEVQFQLLEPPRRLFVHRGEILVRVRKVTRASLDGTHELAELRELPVGARHDGAQARRRALVLVENIAELLRARGRHRARRARGTN